MVGADWLSVALLAVTVLFAVINGANDGSALVSNAMRVPSIRPLSASFILAAAVGVVPLVLGTAVADTLSSRLVTFSGDRGTTLMLIAVSTTVVIVFAFTRMGLPTSLTLALIGGIVGAGFGAGAPVAWSVVWFVLLAGLCSPLVGGGAGWLITRSMRRWNLGVKSRSVLAHTHRVAFTAQSVAYSINDGQKGIAVLSIALASLGGSLVWWHFLGLGVLFWLGSMLGLQRVGRTIGSGFIAVRPWHSVSAELATTGAVVGSSLFGAPVSMTQTMASALVGSGASESPHRVKWKAVMSLGVTWIVTLPTACLVAAIAGGAVRLASQ